MVDGDDLVDPAGGIVRDVDLAVAIESEGGDLSQAAGDPSVDIGGAVNNIASRPVLITEGPDPVGAVIREEVNASQVRHAAAPVDDSACNRAA